MYVYLSKILPVFVMPVTLGIALVLLALVLQARGKTKAVSAVLIAAVALLWAASTPIVAAIAYGKLESHFPPHSLDTIPVSGCIVLLGGVMGLPLPPRQDIELGDAVDRVYKTAQLYREGKGTRVFVTAGNQPWSAPGPSEASLIGELLVEWGVPATAIQLEGRSRNTRENALHLQPQLEAAHCDRALLVTSAAHMPRALASFTVLGLAVYPVSTDVRVLRPGRYRLADFLPDAHALAMTSDALREWIGQRVYAWRGWN